MVYPVTEAQHLGWDTVEHFEIGRLRLCQCGLHCIASVIWIDLAQMR